MPKQISPLPQDFLSLASHKVGEILMDRFLPSHHRKHPPHFDSNHPNLIAEFSVVSNVKTGEHFMGQIIGPERQSIRTSGQNDFEIYASELREPYIDLKWRCVCLWNNWALDVPAGQVDGYCTTCEREGCGRPAYFVLR